MGRCELSSGFFLAAMIWAASQKREFIQAQIGADHRRQLQCHFFDAAIDFALHHHFIAGQCHLLANMACGAFSKAASVCAV